MHTINEDYENMLIALLPKFRNKALLKRIYNLAEYLYIHVDGGISNG